MDYMSFSREIFRLISLRLPAALLPDPDPAFLSRYGGWFYPSARDPHAFFFDCRTAYRSYLAGATLSEIADALECDFLSHQWEACGIRARLLSPSGAGPQWALRLRSVTGSDPLPSRSLCLFWDRYALEPYCRFLGSDSLQFRPVAEEDLALLSSGESAFWERFWRELAVQDPPELLAVTEEGREAEAVWDAPEKVYNAPEEADAAGPPADCYLLSGRRGLYGAAVIFYPNLLRLLHRRFGCFRLLLSSPHEVMLFPEGGRYQPEDTVRMLYEVREKSDPAGGLVPALYQYTVDAGLTPC